VAESNEGGWVGGWQAWRYEAEVGREEWREAWPGDYHLSLSLDNIYIYIITTDMYIL